VEKQEIFQDVKFGQELLEVNQLFVMERINNVLFVGGVAQVLRKIIIKCKLLVERRYLMRFCCLDPSICM
jgi:hypothetical protein